MNPRILLLAFLLFTFPAQAANQAWPCGSYQAGCTLRFNNTTASPSDSTFPAGTTALIGGDPGTPTCGAGCTSITAGSTNARGSLTSGSAVTSVTVNWSGTLGYTPTCTIMSSSTISTGATASTTTLVYTALTAITTQKLSWICAE